MKRFLLLSLAALPLAFQSFAQTNGNSESGQRLFMKNNCYYCHGTAGQGGRDGARIAQTPLSAQALIRYVRRPTGRMPAFSEKTLSDQQLTDITAYLKALPPAKSPKDIPLLKQLP